MGFSLGSLLGGAKNLGTGALNTALAQATIAERKRQQQQAQITDLLKSGMVPGQGAGGGQHQTGSGLGDFLANTLGGPQRMDVSKFTPGAHHPSKVAEANRLAQAQAAQDRLAFDRDKLGKEDAHRATMAEFARKQDERAAELAARRAETDHIRAETAAAQMQHAIDEFNWKRTDWLESADHRKAMQDLERQKIQAQIVAMDKGRYFFVKENGMIGAGDTRTGDIKWSKAVNEVDNRTEALLIMAKLSQMIESGELDGIAANNVQAAMDMWSGRFLAEGIIKKPPPDSVPPPNRDLSAGSGNTNRFGDQQQEQTTEATKDQSNPISDAVGGGVKGLLSSTNASIERRKRWIAEHPGQKIPDDATLKKLYGE